MRFSVTAECVKVVSDKSESTYEFEAQSQKGKPVLLPFAVVVPNSWNGSVPRVGDKLTVTIVQE